MEQAKKKIIHKVRSAVTASSFSAVPAGLAQGGCADEALTGTKDDRPEF